jgi:hypothetical protein
MSIGQAYIFSLKSFTQILDSTVALSPYLIQEFRGVGEEFFPPATYLPAQRLRSKQNIQRALWGGGSVFQVLEFFQIKAALGLPRDSNTTRVLPSATLLMRLERMFFV